MLMRFAVSAAFLCPHVHAQVSASLAALDTAYASTQSSGMSGEQARQQALEIGIVAGACSLLLPLSLWFLFIKPWKPATRLAWAAKFATWPGLLVSFQLGAAAGRELFSIRSPYLMDLSGAFQGWLGCTLILGALCIPIGYAVAPGRFRGASPPGEQAANDVQRP